MFRTAHADDLEGDARGPHRWTNRLVRARSPYLRRHAHDPVDWLPWGPEAFAAARDRQVPIFLSIGYSACLWCRRMQEETFSDPAAAARLNAHFVPVKVDREERPDVDGLYMAALLRIQGQAGWPASLFLHPDLRPFTGATYLPPAPKYGLPGFTEILERVITLWADDRDTLESAGDALRRDIRGAPERRAPAHGAWKDALVQLVGLHDALNGGFGDGAKFPQVPENELLLLAAAHDHDPARRAVRRNLDAMAGGALADAVGGGFHRYCAAPDFTEPHLEKMLSDNAQLLRLYARSSRVFDGRGRPGTAAARRDVQVARDTVRYLWSRLLHPDGGFAASESSAGADAFYRWTAAQVREVLGADAPVPYGITDRPSLPRADRGEPPRAAREALVEARDRRERPPRDDTRIVAWNGLAIAGLAEAGRLLDESSWVALAATTADRVLAARLPDGRLPRLLDATEPGVLEDHAAVADGLLALAQARPAEPRWLLEALAVTRCAIERFRGPDGGFLHSTASELPVQRRPFVDEAEPSGNGRMAEVLRRLELYGALPDSLLDELLAAAGPTMAELPAATPELHGVLRGRHGDPAPMALVLAGHPDHPELVRMLRVWDHTWRPHGVVALAQPALEGFDLLRDRHPGPGGAPRAWLCRRGACGPPIETAEALRRALS